MDLTFAYYFNFALSLQNLLQTYTPTLVQIKSIYLTLVTHGVDKITVQRLQKIHTIYT